MKGWQDIFLPQNFTKFSDDERHLVEALRQGYQGLGLTSPNPSVGCVIVSPDNSILARGFHKKAGLPHAEIEALNQIDPVRLDDHGQWILTPTHIEKLKNATLYVTLEPCAHEGRTPSCAKTLAHLPIKKVISILTDPNPLVSGKGFHILNQAGVKTECLELNELNENRNSLIKTARHLHGAFLKSVTQKVPFITIKMATSLDGMMGLKNGQSKWITSEPSRLISRELRGTHDALLTGAGTVLADNPRLDLRDTHFEEKNYVLLIWDNDLKVLEKPELQVFKQHKKIVFLTTNLIEAQKYESISNPQYEILLLSESNPLYSLNQYLIAQKIQSVFVEAGPGLTSYLVSQNYFDQIYQFIGPKLLGGAEGLPWTSGIKLNLINEALELEVNFTATIGKDLLIVMSNFKK